MSRRLDLLLLSFALLAAFTLRIWLLGDQNIWWDEGLAVWAIRQGWAPMTLWTASDVHPPLYFWLLKAWVSLAGESEFSARFVSLICGLVAVAAMYPLARILLRRRVALLATFLLAFSRFHIWWSQEMRMYIVATMWGVLSVYALLRWWRAENWWPYGRQSRHSRQWPAAVLYVLATAAGLYTLYLFVTILLIENLFFVFLLLRQAVPTRGDMLRRWVTAQSAILVTFAPWLALALPLMRSWSVAEPFRFGTFLHLYATLLTLGISTYVEHYTGLVAPFFAIIGAAAIVLWRTRRSSPALSLPTRSPVEQGMNAPGEANHTTAMTWEQAATVGLLLGLFLGVPTLVVYALTRPRQLFYAPRVEARYLILFAPAFVLLLAWALTVLRDWRKWMGWIAAIFVGTAFVWTLPQHYAGRYLRDEHQTMVRIIAAYAEAGDAVLLVAGNRYPIFGYYYERLPNAAGLPPVYALPRNALQIGSGNVDAELTPLATAHRRLWLAQVNAPMQDPQGLVDAWLGQRYAKLLSFGFAHNALTLYGPEGTPPQVQPGNLTPQYSLTGAVESGGVLLGYDLPTREFRPGDVIRLALYYSSPQEMDVTLYMLDTQGRVLEQDQVLLPPAQPIGRWQFEFTIYSHTPSGLYHFAAQIGNAGQVASFGSLRVAATQPLPRAGEPSTRVFAQLEGGIELLGYALNVHGQPVTQLRAGDQLTLDLYWICRQKVPKNYTVFAHLVGSTYNPATAGPVWAGHDSAPLEHGYPTRQWFVNQVIRDRHVLNVDAQAPSGEYELEVGMYLLETMQRLRVIDHQGQSSDRIVLRRLEVVQP